VFHGRRGSLGAMFQPNACIEVENDKANNQFDRGWKIP